MRKSELIAGCVAFLAATSFTGVAAQTAPTASGAAPDATADAPPPAREPEAIAALERMGASLRKLTNFSVTAEATTEEVLTTGQKLQYGGTIDLRARVPDRLRLDSVSDRKTRHIYYDGKSLTVFAPKLGYYGSVPAPSTIRAMLTEAQARYDIEFPLADFFDLGVDPTLTAKLTSAFLVRPERIGADMCDHYAMRQENADWQVWIRQGAEALPCKMIITTSSDPSMPQYVAVLKWNTNAANAESVFAFQPPANTKKIVIGQVNPK